MSAVESTRHDHFCYFLCFAYFLCFFLKQKWLCKDFRRLHLFSWIGRWNFPLFSNEANLSVIMKLWSSDSDIIMCLNKGHAILRLYFIHRLWLYFVHSLWVISQLRRWNAVIVFSLLFLFVLLLNTLHITVEHHGALRS